MLAAVLLAALAASPSVGTKGLTTFGVKPDVGEFYTSTLQRELLERGVNLVIRAEADVAGKVALCDDDKPCAFVIRGTLAQLGDKTRLELELVGSDGKRVARHSAVGTDAAALADQIGTLADQLAGEINGAAPKAVVAQPVEKPVAQPVEKPVEGPADKPADTPVARAAQPSVTSSGLTAPAPEKKTRLWWLPLLGSVVLVGAGGGCFAVAQSDHSSLAVGAPLTAPMYTYADARAIANEGKSFETLGWVAMGLAGAAAITSVLLWYFGSAP